MNLAVGKTFWTETSWRASPGWQLLSSRNFGLLWSGQVISQIGDSLTKVALLWFVYQLTGSALKVTEVGVLQTLPPLLLGPLIGVYLDRLPKKLVMVWVDLSRTFLILLIPLLYSLGVLTLAWLYAVVFLTAMISTVFGPALASVVPALVRPTQLTTANALIQTASHIGVLVGPALSGLLIALIGPQNVLSLDAATFFVSALCLLLIRMHPEMEVTKASIPVTTISRELLTGIRFIFVQHRTISLLLLTTALYTIGTSSFVLLLPVFAMVHFGVNSVWLGWLWSAWGAGMLLASAGLVWGRQRKTHERFRSLVGALIVGGLAIGGLSLSHSPFTALALVPMVGGSTALFTPLLWSLLQELTPQHLLGRVFTMMNATAMAASSVGMTIFGWAIDAVGTSMSLIIIGLLLLGTATAMRGYVSQLSGVYTTRQSFQS